jgi:uncharacterized protein YhfF
MLASSAFASSQVNGNVFAEVTDDFARAEGEGFAGHLDWATAHRAYWERIGRRIDENTPVVCLRFTLL